ncbi:coniferyl aldehyde dehydrogenase [Rehaibacterium terrae]|jgi:coniferyl-aldehyde dehydrogenase|uniref:Aldehyde dehydrogenase n=1 Tax=Rehaibacterium terrae TaxID=1341696 RepID=A0A7W7XXW7_9GAMM|nr:coniferyl aldehyde dehydrogenase [Rehaibacterium terrae]MBB5014199.1 coniferyl-aldehyde dehydrogenase [Rehaibacterium terrae]
MDTPTDTPPAELTATLRRLRGAWQARMPDYAQRRDDLERLRAAFKAKLPAMSAAIAADFGHRSPHESAIADGMTVLKEIDHLLAHLKGWMRPRRRMLSPLFWPARAEIRYQPLGVVGVISPWNYPVNLALIPLADAIAAGNHVYLKPSEHTPRTSLCLRELLAEVFPADRVAVALGGPALAAAFAGLPFDHLLFTGSTAVGRKVMAAAAPNLTPVTLELGGKSPALIAEGYPLARAAARIASGKWLNAGQTCIAPDYVLVPQGQRDAFVEALRREVGARYPTLVDNPDYTRIVNAGQYRRLRGYLDEAQARRLPVIELVPLDAALSEGRRILPPTLVLDPPDDTALMREEIFGPILPVCGYRSLDEALAYVQSHERPLAFYLFDDDRARREKVLAQIVAGGVTVNDTLMHNAQSCLPFGGVGASGMGHYHGHAGFLAFSKPMPVFRQARFAGFDLFRPPYRGLADRLVKLLTR